MKVSHRNPASVRHRTLAVVLTGFCAFLNLYATQPLLPLLAHVFGAPEVSVSMTVTASTLGVALAAPFFGLLADRRGRKRVIVPAALLTPVPVLLAAFARTLPELIAMRFLQGVLTAGVVTVTVAYIHEEWEDGGAGSATAAYVSGTVLGGFSGRMIAGLAAARFGWRAAFVALSALSGLAAVAVGAWLPDGRRFARAPSRHSPLSAIHSHIRNRKLLATYAAGFCVLFSLTASFTYVTFYLAAPPFGLGAAALGSLFTVYLVGAAVTPAAGRFIDRLGARAAVAAAMIAAALAMSLTLSHHLWMVLAGLTLCSSGVFVAQSAASSYIGRAASKDLAAATGLYSTFYYLGGSAGAAVPGLLWRAGGWAACVILIVSVQAATAALALALWEDEK